MTDQQRADTIEPNSICQTPALDRLRASGVHFRRCYAPNPICSPVRASLLTGLLPHSHGMVDCTHTVPTYRAALEPGLPFWSRQLRDAGYRTGYFGKWHVERSNRLEDFGFDDYEITDYFVNVHEKRQSPAYISHRRRLGLDTSRANLIHEGVVRQRGYRDLTLYAVTDEPVESTREHFIYDCGLAFLDAAAQEPDRPFLLFLSTPGPHDPYIVPQPYFEQYDVARIPHPPNFDDDLSDRPAIYRRLQEVWRTLTWEQIAEATACYYGLCSMIDTQIGRLLDALDRLALTENTLIVFCSDHGDFMGAHRLFTKGIPAFEEAYRVPLLISGAGVPKGLEISNIVSLLDLAPTLIALTLEEEFPGHGRSLLPLLNEEVGMWEDEAFAEMHGQRFSYTQRVLWRGRYKYVFNTMAFDELYDLTTDPHELKNLASDPACQLILETMANRMWQIIHNTGDFNMYNAEDAMYRFAPSGPRGAPDQESDNPAV